jgi:UDP-N-acetylmuramate-alanine ligase
VRGERRALGEPLLLTRFGLAFALFGGLFFVAFRSRLRDLFDGFCTAFNTADIVFVAPVYAAGETPIPGYDRDALVEGLRIHGHRDARALAGPEALAGEVAATAGPGDYVVLLGAGSIARRTRCRVTPRR